MPTLYYYNNTTSTWEPASFVQTSYNTRGGRTIYTFNSSGTITF